jgi:uncharacterized protein (TIGR02145 family)
MRKTFLYLFIGFISFTACKKSDHSTENPPNKVEINGAIYQTVVIGRQTWTAENYIGPGGIVSPWSDEGTGKFYLLAAIKVLTLPAGWRIPTQEDFNTLIESQGPVEHGVDGSVALNDSLETRHLRSHAGWRVLGDNKSGFNAQPAGSYNAYMDDFPDHYSFATFWSSTPGTNTVDTPSQCILILSGYRTSRGTGNLPIEFAWVNPIAGVLNRGYSLRFVKDN